MMSKKMVIPFIVWILFLAINVASLVRGIDQHENWRIFVAGAGLACALGFLLLIVRFNAREMKAVPLRNKN